MRIYGVEGGLQRALDGGLGRITALEFSPNGRILAICGGLAGSSGSVTLRSWPEGHALGKVGGFRDEATGIAWHPKGNRIAISSADRTVSVHEVPNDTIAEKPIYRLVKHSRAVLDLCFDPAGELLVTASADRSLKVWEADDGHLMRSLANHTEIVNAVAMRPLMRFGGQTLPPYCASAGDDKTVRIWQPGIGRMVRIVRYHDAEVTAIVWHPSGKRLYSADRDGVVRIIDGESDRILGKWKAHDDWIYALAIDPEGKYLATGDWSGVTRQWDLTATPPRLIRDLLESGSAR